MHKGRGDEALALPPSALSTERSRELSPPVNLLSCPHCAVDGTLSVTRLRGGSRTTPHLHCSCLSQTWLISSNCQCRAYPSCAPPCYCHLVLASFTWSRTLCYLLAWSYRVFCEHLWAQSISVHTKRSRTSGVATARSLSACGFRTFIATGPTPSWASTQSNHSPASSSAPIPVNAGAMHTTMLICPCGHRLHRKRCYARPYRFEVKERDFSFASL